MSTTGQPMSTVPSRRRFFLLIGGLGVLAMLAIGAIAYQRSRPTLPAIPAIDLTGADPEIAAALASARERVVKSPRSADAWGRLALVLHAHSYREDAMIAYSAAAVLDDQDPTWPYLQAVILHDGAEPATALPYLHRAADLSPPNSLPRVRLAELLTELGQLDEARAEFQRILTASPAHARAQFGAAELAARRQQPQIALQYLEAIRASALVRNRACALRVALFTNLGETDTARREEALLARLPRDPPWPDEFLARVQSMQVGIDARLARAADLERQNRYIDALALLEETARRYPQSDEAWSLLGNARGRGNDHAGAEDALRKCTELAPDRSEHWHFLGVAQQHRRHCKEALVSFRQAIQRNPRHAPTYLELGKCLRDLGDRAGAADAFRSALQYQQDLDEARQELAKLSGKS